MATLDRPGTKAKVDSNIKNTGQRETTADLVREVLKDFADSYLNLTTDADLLRGLADYNPAKNYATGEGCFYNGFVYRANKPTTGAFTPADWNSVIDIANGGMVGRDTNTYVSSTTGGDEMLANIPVLPLVLIQPGQILRVKAQGVFGASSDPVTLKLQVGPASVVAFTWATVANGNPWWIEVDLIVEGGTFQALARTSDRFVSNALVAANPEDGGEVKFLVDCMNVGDVTLSGFTLEKIGTLK